MSTDLCSPQSRARERMEHMEHLPPSVYLKHSFSDIQKSNVKASFLHTYATYQRLFQCLSADEAYYQSPEPLRQPLIFYFGHTAAFYINKLRMIGMVDFPVNPQYESLFAVGVDEMPTDDVRRGDDSAWPSVSDLRDFRSKVEVTVLKVIDSLPLGEIVDWNHPVWVVLMAIEHELIHLETTSVLIRQLSLKFINSNIGHWDACIEESQPTVSQSWVTIPEGTVKLGISRPSEYYGWDNEYGEQVEEVPIFEAGTSLVTNAHFLEFVLAEGYNQLKWWSPEGASWLLRRNVRLPVFWVPAPNERNAFRLRTLLKEISMPLNWPVEVNYHEAKAFCSWYEETYKLPVRLPTESEWHRMYEHANLDKNSWKESNLALNHFASSCSVTQFNHGKQFDIIGNVWQWTETPVKPFKGFSFHPIYDDFSTPTFDNEHIIAKGGSWISGGNLARRESRYAFRKHFYQHSGFRMVISGDDSAKYCNPYESYNDVSLYLDAHYNGDYLGHTAFAVQIVDYGSRFAREDRKQKALDLGCAVGRSTFELSRYFDEVTGIDLSTQFIRHAANLKKNKMVCYSVPVEGDLSERKVVYLNDLRLKGGVERVFFTEGDACNLPSKYTNYDLVLASNLLCRLQEPRKFLKEINCRINPGGLLVLSTPFTWMESFTKKENWAGGTHRENNTEWSSEVIHRELNKHFDFVNEANHIPFILRETSRKFQYILPEITVWRRKEFTQSPKRLSKRNYPVPVQFEVLPHNEGLLKSTIINRKSARNPQKIVLETSQALACIDPGPTTWKLSLSSKTVLETLPVSSAEVDGVRIRANWIPAHALDSMNISIHASDDANVFGLCGVLFVEEGLKIPCVDATVRNVSNYGLRLFDVNEPITLDEEYTTMLMEYTYKPEYVEEFLTDENGGGGYFVEKHSSSHIHIPLSANSTGHIIIGKQFSSNDFCFTAFRIPFGKVLVTPGGTIHGDGALVGKYAISIGPTCQESETVLFYNHNSKMPAKDILRPR